MPALPTVGGSASSWGTALNEFLQVAHNADGTVKSSVLASAYLHYIYNTAHTVNPVAITKNAWTLVPLNTEVHDSASLGTLSANKITLAAGTYMVKGSMNFTRHSHAQLGLFKTAGEVLLVAGLVFSNNVADYGGGAALLDGFIVLTEQTEIDFRYYVKGTYAYIGAAESTGAGEYWASLVLLKIG